MTEEELKKKAEEYATEQEKNCILGVYENIEELQYDEGYNRGYVIGLEEGYIAPVNITNSNCEHKNYRNQGRKMATYNIEVSASQPKYRI